MLPILTLITLPDPTEAIASTTVYSSAIFDELLPYALAVTGLILGALFVRFIVVGGLKGAVMKLIGGGKRGGKRRRR